MIVQTRSGRRGAVVRVSPPDTPRDARRVYVRLRRPGGSSLDIGPRWPGRPPARVIVAYVPEDVIEVRQLPDEGKR